MVPRLCSRVFQPQADPGGREWIPHKTGILKDFHPIPPACASLGLRLGKYSKDVRCQRKGRNRLRMSTMLTEGQASQLMIERVWDSTCKRRTHLHLRLMLPKFCQFVDPAHFVTFAAKKRVFPGSYSVTNLWRGCEHRRLCSFTYIDSFF